MEHPLDLRRLEELGLNSSAPPGQLLYDGWLLRMLPGQAKRARSVNAIYPSSLALPDKIAYCQHLYQARGLPLIFRVTPFSEPASLDGTLQQMGYPRFDTTAVESARIDPARLSSVGTEAMALADWVQAVGALRNSPELFRTAHLARLQATLLPYRALVVREGGEVLATGLTIAEGDWAGLFDIVTAPAARRQGHGRRIVEGLLHAASELGAHHAYLQVDAGNLAARRLYAHYGFTERYRYWYRGHSD
jgi:N-acetylglutamate synthase